MIGKIQLAISRDRIRRIIIKNSLMNLSLFFGLLATIVVTIIIISRVYIFQPLTALETAVTQIGTGELETPIHADRRDEIGQLAAAFKLMMENIKSVTASRDDLDQEIQVRLNTEKSLKASVAEKEVLLKEIHHRVKNNLQIIQSLLSLQSNHGQGVDKAATLQDSINRIRSIALVHETLYQSENLKNLDLQDYVSQLIKHLSNIYYRVASKVDIDLQIDPIQLDLDTSISCGLIINELVTNAFKYAFDNKSNGHLTVQMVRVQDSTIELSVMDDGQGPPAAINFETPETLGLRIISMLAVDQLKGTLSVDAHSGFSVKIRFPVTA